MTNKVPHKHAELIKQWADGAEIQHRGSNQEWRDIADPSWFAADYYRVKQEREFPKSTLCDAKLARIFNRSSVPLTDSLREVADTAVKQYILDTEK